MTELTQKYRSIMGNLSLEPMERNRQVGELLKLKSPFTSPPKDDNYDRYGKNESIRLWNKGFYPEIKLLYNERPKGNPNDFAKAMINPSAVVVSDLCIDNYAPRTRALSSAINKTARGNDLLVVGNLLSKKYRKRWDLVAEFINDLRVGKMYLILGPYDVFSCDDYLEFGFSFVTDRAEKRFHLTKIIYSYFPVPVKKNQLNIHGHPSDNMYQSIGSAWHYDASPSYGLKSVAVNTLGNIIEEVSEKYGKDI